MKLNYEPLGLEIIACEGEIIVLQIESVYWMREFMYSLWKQISGEDGDICIYDDKVVSLAKSAELISNIFDVDINNKKIVSCIYKELTEIAKGDLIAQTNQFQSDVVAYVEEILEKSTYQVDYDLDVDISGLFKLMNIHLRNDSENILENLAEYLKLTHRVCGITYFFVFHLKELLTEAELDSMYELCAYEKIKLIIIESHDNRICSKYEKNVVVDKDLCII